MGSKVKAVAKVHKITGSIKEKKIPKGVLKLFKIEKNISALIVETVRIKELTEIMAGIFIDEGNYKFNGGYIV